MKILVVLVLLGLHSAAGVTHSAKNIYTASSGVQNFPEFVVVGMVNDVQNEHYDSNTKRKVPKQEWMNRVTEDVPQYWERGTEIFKNNQQEFKGNIQTLKNRFNQTKGVHVVQWMLGCEWDNVTGEVNGFSQYRYDGEDFISLDMKTLTWIAPKPQAVITKHKWESAGEGKRWKNILTQECVDELKQYLKYGRSSLMRTDLPSVSLLQKTPSSPVSCFATGFYPDRAMMFWRKDGEELHEDVERGEILPNHDGSFQIRVDLDLSSVPSEDWGRYKCVFQLSGVTNDIITKLDKAVVKSNEGSSGFPLGVVIGVGVGLLLVLVCVVGCFLYRRNNNGQRKGFQPANSSDSGSDTSDPLKQKA